MSIRNPAGIDIHAGGPIPLLSNRRFDSREGLRRNQKSILVYPREKIVITIQSQPYLSPFHTPSVLHDGVGWLVAGQSRSHGALFADDLGLRSSWMKQTGLKYRINGVYGVQGIQGACIVQSTVYILSTYVLRSTYEG